MKILQIASGDLWGGAEAQVHTLCKYLAQEDHLEVYAVVLNYGTLEERLKRDGIAVIVLDETKMSFVEILLRLRAYIKQLKPDIVHTHRQKENIVGSIANLFSVRAPSVRSQHGAPEFSYSWADWKNKLQRSLDVFCGRFLQKRVIAVSAELADKLEASYSRRHIEVIENGVDLEALADVEPDAPFKLQNPSCKHVGIVGRLVPVKRVDIFLDTARLILDSGEFDEQIAFHVIGDGPLREELEDQVSKLELGSSVTFHGHVENSSAYIKSLDVLIMCSDHEGLPMVLLEAIGLGVPCIGHNVGALVPSFEKRLGGIRPKDNTGNSIKQALKELEDKNKADLIEQGRQSLVAKYSAIANMSRILKLYKDLNGLSWKS